jgi:hypothetical protein
MKPVIETPATVFDMAELGGATTQVHWAVAREMWSGGETFAMRRGDRLLGLFGLYPCGDGAEAWFNIAPAGADHMLWLIRQIRLTLASRSYPEIAVICTTAAGCRIAVACGFQFVKICDLGEIWTYGRFAGRLEQGREPAETAGGGATAPNVGEPSGATG